MQPILDQEKLFFDLTKTIMNDKDSSTLNFSAMSENTKKSGDFMQRLLHKSDYDERFFIYYLQTCKVECAVRFIIKRL
jgi:hypothetical protein